MQAYDLEKEMLDAVKCKIASNAARCKLLEQFVQTLQNQTEIIEEFDESLWLALVECVEIGSTTDVRFIMKDGEKIRI